jgi:hypothetical protein
MVTRPQPERMLGTEERALLELCTRAGPEGYPVVQLGGQWTWEYGPLGAPKEYDTRDEAVHNLELQLSVLRDAERVEREQTYSASGRGQDAAPAPRRAIAEPFDG